VSHFLKIDTQSNVPAGTVKGPDPRLRRSFAAGEAPALPNGTVFVLKSFSGSCTWEEGPAALPAAAETTLT
jgi:hypothetical protein